MVPHREAPFLVTGFGPFLDVHANPSGALARWADGRRLAGRPVVGRELPVSLTELPAALERAVLDCEPAPAALVSLGVQREAWWRVERRARRPLSSLKPDAAGVVAAGFDAGAAPEERPTVLDAERLAAAVAALGLDARASDDAGGYVCEWCYHHLLGHGLRLGVPAVFLHVPPAAAAAKERQRAALEALLAAVVEQLPRG